MKKSTGYKEMLRDRCPKVVDFALKWCNAKERWLNHAYNQFVKIYLDKEQRKTTVRIILGIDKYYKRIGFAFDKSIDWDDLTPEDTAYWKRVSGWVRWFTSNYAYIENMYNCSHSAGKNEFECKVQIINAYLSSLIPEKDDEKYVEKLEYVDKLADYLVKCITVSR